MYAYKRDKRQTPKEKVMLRQREKMEWCRHMLRNAKNYLKAKRGMCSRMWSYWQVRWYLWQPDMAEGLSLLPHVVIKQRPKSNLWKKGLFGSSVTNYSPHHYVLSSQRGPLSHHSVPLPNQSSLFFHHHTLLCNHNVPLVSPSRCVSGWALPWGYLTTRLHSQ